MCRSKALEDVKINHHLRGKVLPILQFAFPISFPRATQKNIIEISIIAADLMRAGRDHDFWKDGGIHVVDGSVIFPRSSAPAAI